MGLLRAAARTILGIDVLVLVLLGFSVRYLEPGTGASVAAVLTLVPTVLTLVAALAILYTGWDPV